MVNPSSTTFSPVSFNSTHPNLDGLTVADHDLLCTVARPKFPLDEQWESVFVTPCTFAPAHFHHVMDNLLRNPNLTSSCLFRADVLYDSAKDPDADLSDDCKEHRGLRRYMKHELRPRQRTTFDSFTKHREVVRTLVPRNPQLDRELVQTVCFLSRTSKTSSQREGEELTPKIVESMVIYIPHEDNTEAIPYYHPKVQSLALLHTFDSASHSGSLSIHYRLPSTNMSLDNSSTNDQQVLERPSLTKRLERTALNLLRIVNKHAHGQQAGYQKRVHHDVLIDQVSFQNRYTKLKQKYAKSLLDTWAEVTDPQKHVFEDLGIAAFLIEIWHGMYGKSKKRGSSRSRDLLSSATGHESQEFPGFVDIGCGNGVLVHILISEGYEGWGFDVRRRKSWSVFPQPVQDKLDELVLVPKVLQSVLDQSEAFAFIKQAGIHDGVFPAGTFIISNHADQLTPWTPLLAYASNSPFISIPCCSHALNGKLWRFYDQIPSTQPSSSTTHSSDSQTSKDADELNATQDEPVSLQSKFASRPAIADGPGPVSGSLTRSKNSSTKAMPSAYAGFTAYVMRMAATLDYKVESEVLRIPSTRNLSIVARHSPVSDPLLLPQQARNDRLVQLLQQEVGDVSLVARDWIEGAISLKRKAGGGH